MTEPADPNPYLAPLSAVEPVRLGADFLVRHEPLGFWLRVSPAWWTTSSSSLLAGSSGSSR